MRNHFDVVSYNTAEQAYQCQRADALVALAEQTRDERDRHRARTLVTELCEQGADEAYALRARLNALSESIRRERTRAYDRERSRRKSVPRSSTIGRRELVRLAKAEPRGLPLPLLPTRPTHRSGCEEARGRDESGALRPCPFVSCHHHLYLDVNPRNGAIKINFPDREPDQLAETCALDVAERGGATLEQVAAIMNLTRERIRQIEVLAVAAFVGDPSIRELRGIDDVGGDHAEPDDGSIVELDVVAELAPCGGW